jgi:hypothetical protein
MDPLTTLGLLANIIQLIDFGTRAVRNAQDIYRSGSGSTDANTALAAGVNDMKSLSSKLMVSASSPRSDEEKDVSALALEFQHSAEDLLEFLAKLKPKKIKSRFSSAKSALKATWYEKDKQELEQRVRDCQSRLEIQLVAIMR